MITVLNGVTKDVLVNAFQVWETNFRTDPKAYRTYEEIARLSIVENANERGSYLFELLVKLQENT